MRRDRAFDVVVIGEILVEVATTSPFGHGVPAQLGISGDALNVAAAAAAAGARAGLLAVLTDDELGQAIAARIGRLGISTGLLKFRPASRASTWCTAIRPGSGSSPTPAGAASARRWARTTSTRPCFALPVPSSRAASPAPSRLRPARRSAKPPRGRGAVRVRPQLPAAADLRGGRDGGRWPSWRRRRSWSRRPSRGRPRALLGSVLAAEAAAKLRAWAPRTWR